MFDGNCDIPAETLIKKNISNITVSTLLSLKIWLFLLTLH